MLNAVPSPNHLASNHSAPAFPFAAGNQLLAHLPTLDLERIQQNLKPMLLHQGRVLYHGGQKVEKVYFVTAGMVSIVIPSEKSEPVEVGIVGNEGMTGALEAVNQQPIHAEHVVQIRGKALAMPAEVFREEFRRSGVLQTKSLHWIQHLMMVSAQCAACNTQHSVEERLARWLLMVYDRVHSHEMELTHEYMAQMLGVRRSGVTIAAGALRTAGAIEYNRGKVCILDDECLQNIACSCYPQTRHHLNLLTQTLAS